MSVSSSIAPSPNKRSERQRQASWEEAEQDTEPARRRREARRRSSTLVVPEGGHVPFTHHLPSRVAEMQESSGEDSSAKRTMDDDRPISVARDETESIPHSGGVSKTSDKKRKGRLSGLFRRPKKSTENLPKTPLPPTVHPSHHEQARLDHEKAREKYEKELENRRIEQKRRDEELLEGESMPWYGPSGIR